MATFEFGGDQLHLNRVFSTLCQYECRWDALQTLETLSEIGR